MARRCLPLLPAAPGCTAPLLQQRGTTHKISHKAGTISSLVPESKFSQKGSLGTVTLIGFREFKGSGFKPEKISRYGINRIRGKIQAGFNPNRAHLAFSKADQSRFFFFNNFSGFKIKSNSPDFKYGSGNELSAVPIIFTRQSEKFYNTRNLQFFKAQNISKKNKSWREHQKC
jgi:hypothetical protein